MLAPTERAALDNTPPSRAGAVRAPSKASNSGSTLAAGVAPAGALATVVSVWACVGVCGRVGV